MAKQNGDPYCGATSSETSCNTVFIDTNLDTHLAMFVSPSDTVLDLKRKIMSEHPNCFPECGKITVNALKVKRRGFLYYLSDPMLVKNAFEGAKKCWFLYVDASSLKQPDENQMPKKSKDANELPLICLVKSSLGDSSKHRAISSSNEINNNHVPVMSVNEVQKDLEMEVTKVAPNPCSQMFSDFHCGLDYSSRHEKRLSERNVVAETNVQPEGGDSQVHPPERFTKNERGVNKKRKSKKDKAAVSPFTSKDDVDTDEHSSGKAVIGTPKDSAMENLAACNIVSEANVDRRVDDSRVVVDDIRSLRSKSCANRKQKSKKKTQDSVSNCTVENDVDTGKHLSEKAVGEVSVDVEMVNSDAVKEPCCTSFDDAVLKSNAAELHKEFPEIWDDVSKNQVSDVQWNSPSEDTLKSIPASKKRKRSKSKGAGKLQEENTETPMKDSIAPKSSVISEQNNSAAKETLIIKTPKDGILKPNIGEFHKESPEIRDDVSKNQVSDVSKNHIDAVKGPCGRSFDDGILKPNTGEFHQESPEIRDDVSKTQVSDGQGYSPPEDTSKSIPASKKRKKSKSKGAGNLQEETKKTPMEDSIAPNSSVISEKNNSTATETLITKTPQDVGLVPGTSSGKRKKRKRCSKKQEVFVEPPSSRNAGEESGRDDMETAAMNVDEENVEKVPNDIGKVSNLAVDPESDIQLAIPHSGVDKKRKSGKPKSNKSEKNIGEAHGEFTLVADSTQAPSSDTCKGDSIEKPHRVDVSKGKDDVINFRNYFSSRGKGDSIEKPHRVDVSKSKDDVINFRNYFSSRGSDRDEPPIEPVVNAVQKSRGSEIAVKAKKSSKENESERKFNPKNSVVIDRKDAKKPTLSTKKEIKGKVSLENNRAAVAKSSSKGMGKSLLHTPAFLFWDDSSESSEDSDTSTKAPSDYLSSSSDSEKEGASGSRGADYGRSKEETITPQSNRIDMNAILRSSSRFKKVKAAQSQLEDPESQPVDFVPESEPIE